MRYALVLAVIISLLLAGTCTNDEETANWILQGVKSEINEPEQNQVKIPSTGSAPSPVNNPVKKFSLNPATWGGGRVSTSTESNKETTVVTSSLSSTPSNIDNSAPARFNDEANNGSSKLNLTPTLEDTTVDCTTGDNKPGVCVLYYLCNAQTKTVITDGQGLLDVRGKSCRNYLEVCCKIGDVVKDAQSNSDDADLTNSPNRNEGGNSAITTTPGPSNPNGNVQIKKIKNPIRSNLLECGWSNPGANPIILRDLDVGKNSPDSDHGDFPWMVALMKKSSSNVWSRADYLGGGTLIHPSVVMTVAHKLTVKNVKFTPSQLKCRAGEWDTQTDLELYPHQERDVKKYVVHENYYRTSLYNDIALLFLEQPFEMKNAPHMGFGCLATAPPPPGRVCYSMGWGRSDPVDRKKYAHILKKVLLQVVEPAPCQEMLRKNSRLGNLFQLHESLVCAVGSDGVDTCRGDGGAPLVCAFSDDPGEMRYAVYGMVAYGTKCFDPNVPGLYANTVLLKSWVDAQMQQEGFDIATYTI